MVTLMISYHTNVRGQTIAAKLTEGENDLTTATQFDAHFLIQFKIMLFSTQHILQSRFTDIISYGTRNARWNVVED